MEPTIEIRKYPNRRYYNTKDSRHVTLEEIRDLVRDGHDIKVVDSKTDEDITVLVLTQILLEIESPKLAFFPANFLQHLIRLNTDMLKLVTESYFKNSLASFMQGPEAGPSQTAAALGEPFSTAMEDWQRMWLGMTPAAPQAGRPAPRSESDANERVAELSRQIEEMRRALEQLQKERTK